MKFFENFDEKLSPIVAKLDSNKYVNAMKEGMFLSMPIMMIGSVFALLMNFPISSFGSLMASVFGDGWMMPLLIGYFCTISVCSLMVLFGVTRALAKNYGLNEIYTVAIAFVAYIIIMPVETGSLSLPGNCGTGNTLIAIIVAIATVEIVHFVEAHGWTIKLPKEVPAFVAKSFNSLVPDFFVVVIFMIVRIIFANTSYGYFDTFVMSVIAAPLNGLTTSVFGFVIITAIGNLTYWFGISPGTIGSIFSPFLTANTGLNSEAFSAGLPGVAIIDDQFRDMVTCIGGSGSTLAFCILMLVIAKSKQLKAVGKVALVPSIFNVNEPIAFGTPIVFNVRLIIPFLIAPAVNTFITYGACAAGIVPISHGLSMPFTIPFVIKGFLNFGWQGAVLMCLLVVIDGLIYLPFFKSYDADLCKSEAAASEEE